MQELERIQLGNAFDMVLARNTVRKIADSFGFNFVDQLSIATAVFEIGSDFVAYAGRGEIVVSWCDDTQLKGLHLTCNDCGLNNQKLTAKLQSRHSNTTNNFNRLSPKELVDEFSFTKDPVVGNCVTIIKWIRF